MRLSALAHDRVGTGDPVVLIHGIGHRRQAWDPIVPLLARSYEVIAVDLAGFGESPGYPPGHAYNMETACADLVANFAAWGIDRPHVVGNSLGGALALELGHRRLVASATALSPAGFFGPIERYQALIPLTLMRLGAQLPDATLRRTAASPAGRAGLGRLLYQHPERMTAEASYGDALAMKRASSFFPALRAGLRYKFEGSVAVPTTVAWGTEDRLLPYRQATTARRRLPQAHHVALPGAGHVPMIDTPEAIAEIVGETIARAQGATAS